MIRAKVGGKHPYLPAVVNANGRIKPAVALVSGGERRVQGSYHLALPKAAIAAGST